MNTNVNPPVHLASVPPNVLESVAFNLCSLHGFDVAFVRENERFATAVITEYARCRLAGCAPEGGATPFDREGLIALIMEETTDDIVADGWDRLGKPNVLVQGCRYIRRNAAPSPEGYANPEASAKQFAGFIADRILKALATREDAQPEGWRSIESAPKDGTVIDVWRAEGGKDTVHWGKPHHDCGEAGGYCDSDWHSIRAPGWVSNTFDEFLGRNHNPFTHWKPLDEGPDAAPSPAFAHPAPDALRVAVEALKRARWALYSHYVEWDGEPEDAAPLQSAVTDCDQALDALQADQKGGAA